MSFNWIGLGQQAQDASNPQHHSSNMAQGHHNDQNDFDDKILNAAIGYEQGTSKPYTTDRHRAMRILTRKGKILDGNPYRLPKVPDGTEQAMPRRRSDYEVVYHSDALQPIREEAGGDVGLQAPYLDNAALSRLEAGDLFKPEEEWEQIPVSRFSPYDSESPPKKAGLFRSLSKKVMDTVFGASAHRRPEISAPLQDVRYGPELGQDPTRATKYAIPILTPAAELAKSAGSVEEAIEMRRLHPDGPATTLNKSTQRRYQTAVVPKSGDANGRKVRIVGSPDRMTELGDFMNLSDSNSEDYVHVGGEPAAEDDIDQEVEDDDSYGQERRILQARRLQSFRLSRDSWVPSVFQAEPSLASPDQEVHGFGISMNGQDARSKQLWPADQEHDQERDSLHVAPLRSLRRPSKKVDTSRYSWKPPSPTPKTVNQAPAADYGGMTDDHPTVEQLFGEIDQHMAEMDIADHRMSFASYENVSSQKTSRPSSLEMLGLGDDDEEPETMIDTYIEGDQVIWRAGKRIGAKATGPISNLLQQPITDAGAADEDDELAVGLRKKLEALKQ